MLVLDWIGGGGLFCFGVGCAGLDGCTSDDFARLGNTGGDPDGARSTLSITCTNSPGRESTPTSHRELRAILCLAAPARAPVFAPVPCAAVDLDFAALAEAAAAAAATATAEPLLPAELPDEVLDRARWPLLTRLETISRRCFAGFPSKSRRPTCNSDLSSAPLVSIARDLS